MQIGHPYIIFFNVRAGALLLSGLLLSQDQDTDTECRRVLSTPSNFGRGEWPKRHAKIENAPRGVGAGRRRAPGVLVLCQTRQVQPAWSECGQPRRTLRDHIASGPKDELRAGGARARSFEDPASFGTIDKYLFADMQAN